MKKVYLKPDADFVSLFMDAPIAHSIPGGNMGYGSELGDGYWEED